MTCARRVPGHPCTPVGPQARHVPKPGRGIIGSCTWHKRSNWGSIPSATSPRAPTASRSRRRSRCATSSCRASSPIRSASPSSAWASTTVPISRCRRRKWCWRPSPPRTSQDPSRLRRHRAQLRRSGARVRAVLDAQCAVERARRSHRRPRLVHRVVSALRLRPRQLRGALRREPEPLRRAAQAGAGHLEGAAARAAHQSAGLSADRGAALHVGRRRRQPGVGGAGGVSTACR